MRPSFATAGCLCIFKFSSDSLVQEAARKHTQSFSHAYFPASRGMFRGRGSSLTVVVSPQVQQEPSWTVPQQRLWAWSSWWQRAGLGLVRGLRPAAPAGFWPGCQTVSRRVLCCAVPMPHCHVPGHGGVGASPWALELGWWPGRALVSERSEGVWI